MLLFLFQALSFALSVPDYSTQYYQQYYNIELGINTNWLKNDAGFTFSMGQISNLVKVPHAMTKSHRLQRIDYHISKLKGNVSELSALWAKKQAYFNVATEIILAAEANAKPSLFPSSITKYAQLTYNQKQAVIDLISVLSKIRGLIKLWIKVNANRDSYYSGQLYTYITGIENSAINAYTKNSAYAMVNVYPKYYTLITRNSFGLYPKICYQAYEEVINNLEALYNLIRAKKALIEKVVAVRNNPNFK